MMYRFLPAILILQIITVGLTILAVNRIEDRVLVLATGVIAFGFAIIATLWFGTIARRMNERVLSRLESAYRSKQEKLKLKSDRQYTRAQKQNDKHLQRESRRIQGRANRKVTIAMGAVLGLGGLMLFTQFLTAGILMICSAGGVGAGYLMRVRQENARVRQLPKNHPPQGVGEQTRESLPPNKTPIIEYPKLD